MEWLPPETTRSYFIEYIVKKLSDIVIIRLHECFLPIG